jgi:hypothetical protein
MISEVVQRGIVLMKKLVVFLSCLFTVIAVSISGCLTVAPNASSPMVPEEVPSSQEIPPTQTPTPAPERIQGPPLNVKIDYFGIKSTHKETYVVPPKIQLHIVVDDGRVDRAFGFPASNEGMTMNDFHLENLGGQTVFNTASVGDFLRISVVAYSCEDKEATLALWKAMEAFQSGITSLRELYERLPQKKVLIGYYEHTWYASENWGMTPGKYEAVGSDDLRLWFRIWSEKEPETTPKPSFGPEVSILDVMLPPDAKKRSPNEIVFVNTYPTTFSLQNNEAVDITVDVTINGQGRCLDAIAFTGGAVTMPRYGHKEITTKYYYETAGIKQITYTIYYDGIKLDTWSGTLNVLP